MKKSISVILVTLLAAVSLCSCGEKTETESPATVSETVETVEETADETVEETKDDAAEETVTATTEETKDETAEETADDTAQVALPPYEYPGPELFYSVLYQYLIDEYAGQYDKVDVTIPCPYIIAMEESDNKDIKVWGDFWINNYDLNGNTLETRSGGSYPGCIHMSMSDEGGYEVTGMEVVADGSDFEPTAKKIFGDHYQELIDSSADEKGREEIRAQIIANYVAANNLDITAYQDFGWDPVSLPEENIDSFYSVLD